MPLKSRYGIIILLLLLADTAYTFLQHRNVALDGDMPSIILPAPHYEPVLSSPFGIKAISGEAAYASPNRFFVHWGMYHYFRAAPSLFSSFDGPVFGIFTASAVAKTVGHICLILLLARLATRKEDKWNLIGVAVLIVPLFQSAGYYNPVMGIIEQAPTYTCFYAWPSVLMLCWLLLFLKGKVAAQPASVLERLSLFTLTLTLPFTGPLIPGVIAVGFTLLLGYTVLGLLRTEHATNWKSLHQKLTIDRWIALIALGILGLYSLYLGALSTEQQQVDLLARYQRLPEGLLKMLTNKPGLSILIGGIVIHFGLLRRFKTPELKPWYRTEVRFLLLFAALYILLIPFGGYRDYRPDIVRRDTLQPVLLALFYLWGKSGLLLFRNTNIKSWLKLPTIAILSLFTIADITPVMQSSCQEEQLRAMTKEKARSISIDPECRILTWPQNPDQETRFSSELLVLWGILEQGQHFNYAKGD